MPPCSWCYVCYYLGSVPASSKNLCDNYFHLKIIKLGFRKIRNVIWGLLLAGLNLKTRFDDTKSRSISSKLNQSSFFHLYYRSSPMNCLFVVNPWSMHCTMRNITYTRHCVIYSGSSNALQLKVAIDDMYISEVKNNDNFSFIIQNNRSLPDYKLSI